MGGGTIHDQLETLIYALPLVILAFWERLGLTVRGAFYILIGCAAVITLFRVSSFLERGIKTLERGAATLESGIVVRVEHSHPNPGNNKNGGRRG